MTKEFITNYIDKKIREDENYIVCMFYDLRIKHDLSEDEVQKFLELAKIRLENMNYRVYFTGARYTYNNESRIVQDNELMVAICGRYC